MSDGTSAPEGSASGGHEEFTVLAAGYGRLPGHLPQLDGLLLSFPEPVTDKPAAFLWFQEAAQRHKEKLDAYLELLHSRDGDTADQRVIDAADQLHHSITELMIGHGRYAGTGFPSSDDNEPDDEDPGAGYRGEDEEWDPNAVENGYGQEVFDVSRSGATELPVGIALNLTVLETEAHLLRLRAVTVHSDGLMVHLDEALRRDGNQAQGTWEARRMAYYVAGPGEFTATRADGTALVVAPGGGESSENDAAAVAESRYWISGDLDGAPITFRLMREDLGPDGAGFTLEGASVLRARAGVLTF
ncbi:hypothetical protein [Paeniglutamicibacter cryotolerans]|uniref:Uncharacterized protein n=1 Tax=Paeniglutamicibacter cryotolerans TaxID=670079 RepID=A0A839QP42_9MICC|nr:hypothetical protein [Paeniglutamicibacter cryotolerans]MBB2997373.1 hypothetical protein [Paeniglutamicibacter cryotolerans]